VANSSADILHMQMYCHKMVTRYLAQKQFRDIRDKLDSIRKLSNSIQIDVT